MAGIKDLPKVEAVLKVGNAKFVVLNLHHYREFIQKLALTGKIEERDYLEKYPDVAEAIRTHKVASATEHYLKWGYLETRAATLVSEGPAGSASLIAELPSSSADHAARLGKSSGSGSELAALPSPAAAI